MESSFILVVGRADFRRCIDEYAVCTKSLYSLSIQVNLGRQTGENCFLYDDDDADDQEIDNFPELSFKLRKKSRLLQVRRVLLVVAGTSFACRLASQVSGWLPLLSSGRTGGDKRAG